MFQIISDSSCDFSPELYRELDVGIIPYYVSYDGEHYKKEHLEMSITQFYYIMKSKRLFPKTSLPPVQDYLDAFEDALEKGKDVLCICLTSKFSGSYQSANCAKEILMSEYKDRKIEIIDSITVTGTQALLVHEAVKLRNCGVSLEKTIDILEKIKHTGRLYFTVDSLVYLEKGGRIGKAGLFAGTFFDIKPIIQVKNGELLPMGKVRGRKKSIQEIYNKAVQEVPDIKNKEICFVATDVINSSDIKYLKELFAENDIFNTFEDVTIGTTIGAHTGPTPVGVCIIDKAADYMN